jgi:hypothetical protein
MQAKPDAPTVCAEGLLISSTPTLTINAAARQVHHSHEVCVSCVGLHNLHGVEDQKQVHGGGSRKMHISNSAPDQVQESAAMSASETQTADFIIEAARQAFSCLLPGQSFAH